MLTVNSALRDSRLMAVPIFRMRAHNGKSELTRFIKFLVFVSLGVSVGW